GTGGRLGSAFCGLDRQRPRQSLADFRPAHRGKRAELALVASFQETAECAQTGERAHQRPAADIVSAPRSQERAHIGGRQGGEIPPPTWAAPQLRKETARMEEGRGGR